MLVKVSFTLQNAYIMKERKIVPCSTCKVKKYNFDMIEKSAPGGGKFIYFCSLNCFNQQQARWGLIRIWRPFFLVPLFKSRG